MDLDDAVGELYTADPAAFVARRGELAKQATAQGDRDLAATIRALRRPSASAALVNALAHDAPDELAAYLQLGERLRQAQAELAGDRMRDLSRQRQDAAAALVERAVELAGDDASAATRRELDDTLRAAVADPAAGEVVASGRLTRALSYAGFGEVDITAATATPLTSRRPAPEPAEPNRTAPQRPATHRQRARTRPARAAATEHQPASAVALADDPAAARAHAVLVEQQAAAAERLHAATAEADAAAAAVAAADERLEQARREHADAQQDVAHLTEQLARARARVREDQRAEQAAQAEAAQARRDVRAAERAVDSARRHHDALAATESAPEPAREQRRGTPRRT